MHDRTTIDVYDDQAGAYVELTQSDETDPSLIAFIAHLPEDAFVLDLGCGPGAASAEMVKRGFRVDAVDASAAMVKLANETFSVTARQATFDNIDTEREYDAVWANFSLLHASKGKFAAYLSRLHHALKPGGLLHLGMKLGDGEGRDRLGRYYAYYGIEELRELLEKTGYDVVSYETGEGTGLSGSVDPFVTILART